MALPKIALFRGKRVEDGGYLEGDLIQLDAHPFRFIQNGKGGNQPVIYGSEEVKIGGEWHPISAIRPDGPSELR